MLRLDGTGPRGRGSMTGGGRGHCAVPANTMWGRLFGQGAFYGKGGGRSRRNCFCGAGLPGVMRDQRGMRMFGNFGRTLSK